MSARNRTRMARADMEALLQAARLGVEAATTGEYREGRWHFDRFGSAEQLGAWVGRVHHAMRTLQATLREGN